MQFLAGDGKDLVAEIDKVSIVQSVRSDNTLAVVNHLNEF